MKKGLIVMAAVLVVAAAWAAPVYKYAGMWGTRGSGSGQFLSVFRIAVAPDGNVYVTDSRASRVQYFTSTGSYLGQWPVTNASGVDVSPSGTVYVANQGQVRYFTLTGSFLGSWSNQGSPLDVAVAPNGNVYTVDVLSHRVEYFTSTGSFLGSWGSMGFGPGEFLWPAGIAVRTNGTVYVVENGNDRVQYFTPTGSLVGMWGKSGEGPGEFDEPNGIDISNSGIVFVANTYNHSVDYFTSTGSFLGRFGGVGEGPGQFVLDHGVAVSPSDTRVYITDFLNARVQYFDESGTAVVPSSLGRVKALFR